MPSLIIIFDTDIDGPLNSPAGKPPIGKII